MDNIHAQLSHQECLLRVTIYVGELKFIFYLKLIKNNDFGILLCIVIFLYRKTKWGRVLYYMIPVKLVSRLKKVADPISRL